MGFLFNPAQANRFVRAINKVNLHARTLPQHTVALRSVEHGTNSELRVLARGSVVSQNLLIDLLDSVWDRQTG